MFRRVDPIGSTSEHANGTPVCLERTAMGLRVDASCEPGHDRKSNGREFPSQTTRGPTRGMSCGSCTDDRDPGTRKCAYPTTHEKNEGRIDQSSKGARVGWIRQRNDPNPKALELCVPIRDRRSFVDQVRLARQQLDLCSQV